MERLRANQDDFSTIKIIALCLVATLLGVSGVLLFSHHKRALAVTGSTSQQTANTQTKVNPYQGWNTYTSSGEKASFKYPTNWTLTKPVVVSNDAANTDQVGVTSPSGTITISWVTNLTGFGNESGSSYPLHTIMDKSPISAVTGYYVISGTTTLDGSTYYPWIAMQDVNGVLASGVKGNRATFVGKHKLNPSTGNVTGILFATCGARTTQHAPALSQANATAWLSSPEAQDAKQILLSFSDQN